jgi:hypothetical protein
MSAAPQGMRGRHEETRRVEMWKSTERIPTFPQRKRHGEISIRATDLTANSRFIEEPSTRDYRVRGRALSASNAKPT